MKSSVKWVLYTLTLLKLHIILARVIISERKGKTTPNDGVVILLALLHFLEGAILPHLKNLKLPLKNV